MTAEGYDWERASEHWGWLRGKEGIKGVNTKNVSIKCYKEAQ